MAQQLPPCMVYTMFSYHTLLALHQLLILNQLDSLICKCIGRLCSFLQWVILLWKLVSQWWLKLFGVCLLCITGVITCYSLWILVNPGLATERSSQILSQDIRIVVLATGPPCGELVADDEFYSPTMYSIVSWRILVNPSRASERSWRMLLQDIRK